MLDFEKTKIAMWQHYADKEYNDALILADKLIGQSFALEAMHVAGLALVRNNQIENGFNWIWSSLSLCEAPIAWYVNAAHALMDPGPRLTVSRASRTERSDFQRALTILEDGAKRHPDSIWMHYLQGVSLCELQQWDRALAFFDHCIATDPTFHYAQMSKGFTCHMLGRFDEAIDLYSSITNLNDAELEDVVNNRVSVMVALGQQREALSLSLKELPDSQRDTTLFNRSFAYLGLGHWLQGWECYRHREIDPVEQPIAQTLDDLMGKKVFLFHEQGYGDSLMFLRYAKLLRPIVKHLTIGVPKALHRLVQHLNVPSPVTVVCSEEEDRVVVATCEIAVPMLDCPALFKTTLNTIPRDNPYFAIPQAIIDQHRLPATDKPRIGLVWAGAGRTDDIKAHAIDKRRSIPFALLNPMLDLHDQFQFVSLQLADQEVDDDRVLQPLVRHSGDFLDTAGILMQLDLLISIDSSVAHLAGALGRPVWMLSRFDGCWRWLWPEDETDPHYRNTPWYPNTRIFRQVAHNTWAAVIEDVIHALLADLET
jgi:tetratricopeptide (TPR) repeat protein